MNGPTFTAPSAPPGSARSAPRPAPRQPDRPRPEAANAGLLILTYLRLHWLLILFCGSLLGSGLAYAAWTLLPSKYESYAVIRVAATPPSVAAQGDANAGRAEFATYMKTLAQSIKDERLLSFALSNSADRIAELPTLKAQANPIKYLEDKLVVTYSDQSEYMRISLEGDDPEEVRKIVGAVKDAFEKLVVEEEIKQKTELLAQIRKSHVKLEDELKTKSGAMASARMPAPLPPVGPGPGPLPAPPGVPLVPDPSGGVIQAGKVDPLPAGAAGVAAAAVAESDAVKRARFPMLVGKVDRYQTELAQFPVLIKERQVVVERLQKLIKALEYGMPPAEVIAIAEKDPEVQSELAKADTYRREYDHLRNVIGNPDSERVKTARTKAEAAEAEAKRLTAVRARAIETARRQTEANKLYQQLDAAERSVKSLEDRARVTQKLLDDTRKELAEMPPEIKKSEEKGPLVRPDETDLRSHDAYYSRLTTKMIGLELELQSPRRVQVYEKVSTPYQKDTKKQILATIAAALMGFGLIGFGVVAYETRVKKVSSLGELKVAGSASVVGVIPWMPDGSVARDPVRRADVNEAVDKLRAYVVQTWLSRGATTVAVTSPLGDEGKSFTAFGLASSLAQAGYKTLLVDFDLRNPSLHNFAGVANGTGVCELLRGDADPRLAAVALPNGLHFVPAGKWSDEARRAAVGGRLETLLARLREPFDCVILHGHALLTVAESVEIARRSEVVLLCTLYRETRMPLVRRAAERIAAMEVPYSGVVYLGATPHEALC